MSLNKIMLIGRVGKDPDVRALDGGVKLPRLLLPLLIKAIHLQTELRFLSVPNGIM